MRPAAIATGIVLGAAVVAGALWLRARAVPEAPPAPRPGNLSRFDAAFERELLGLRESPAFRERLQGLPPDDLRAAIQGLGAKGMRRLPDERLDERTALVGRMLQGLDVGTCSDLVTGRQSAAVHDAAVVVLDPDSVDRWVALVFEAARSELEARPAPEVSEGELRLALSVLFKSVPEAEQERLRQGLAALEDASPPEACWAARTTYAAVPQIPRPLRGVLARELASP